MQQIRLKDIGEKELIRKYIKPLFNPTGIRDLIGDDCAVVNPDGKTRVCLSTDRVPADLISFKIGILDYYGLGYYLAILNISDIVSSGAQPIGLLLTLAFQENFMLADFQQFLMGVKEACDEYECAIIGGDLSSSSEMSISATSVGLADSEQVLYRSGAHEGDYIFCSDFVGLTATAFAYFLEARPQGLRLSDDDETALKNQFRRPRARIKFSQHLCNCEMRVTCMDNTDGIGQSLLELSETNKVSMVLSSNKLPIHRISNSVAEFLKKDPVDMVLGPGADFQLIGTIESRFSPEATETLFEDELQIIGFAKPGNGIYIEDLSGRLNEHKVIGWNYYVTAH